MSIIGSFSPIASGVGSPEGKVAAPVGSIYTDTAATNGAIRWIKTSGTGNTGWVVEYGDTGLRDITSLIEGDTDTGTVRIQRIGNTVTLTLALIPIPDEGTFTFLRNLVPMGFQSAFSFQYFGVSQPTSGYASGPLRLGRSADVVIYRTPGEIQVSATATYISTNPWPTSLPGTPA